MTTEEIVTAIIGDVCELPDYTSPDDQPDLLQCRVHELKSILQRHLSARPEALRSEPMAWAVMLPAGYEFDYVVHPHKEEAEREIEEKELPADALVPLFARSPQLRSQEEK